VDPGRWTSRYTVALTYGDFTVAIATVFDAGGEASAVTAVAGFGATVTTNDDSVVPSVAATGEMLSTKAGSAFAATAGAVTFSDVLTLAAPCQYDDIHVVSDMTDAWTSNEVMATLPRNNGSPTVGWTTHQILPWFILRPP
jgi:hypothetical protein